VFGFHAAGCEQIGYLLAELAVTIENRVAVRTRFRKCLPQLLHDLSAGQVFRDISCVHRDANKPVERFFHLSGFTPPLTKLDLSVQINLESFRALRHLIEYRRREQSLGAVLGSKRITRMCY